MPFSADPDVAAAASLASAAHAGQVDKAGKPYIEHPGRVAGRVDGPVAKCVAWLHDVIEDTEVTEDDIREQFGSAVADAVMALTRLPGQDPDDYYRAIVAAGHVALEVKLADIADNTDPERLSSLDASTQERLRHKYAHAVSILIDPT